MGRDPPRLASVGNHVLDRDAQLLLRHASGVRRQDAGMRLDDVGQRPERHADAVGRRAALAPEDHLGASLDLLEELPDESGFSDSRRANERYEPGPSTHHDLAEFAREHLDLASTTHQLPRIAETVGSRVATWSHHLPHRYGLRLALRMQG